MAMGQDGERSSSVARKIFLVLQTKVFLLFVAKRTKRGTVDHRKSQPSKKRLTKYSKCSIHNRKFPMVLLRFFDRHYQLYIQIESLQCLFWMRVGYEPSCGFCRVVIRVLFRTRASFAGEKALVWVGQVLSKWHLLLCGGITIDAMRCSDTGCVFQVADMVGFATSVERRASWSDRRRAETIGAAADRKFEASDQGAACDGCEHSSWERLDTSQVES